MDSANDPTVQMVVFMKCARIGGTESGLNICGFFIDQDPSPQLIVQPTVDDAKDFSKEQLAPMLAETPALAGKVRDPKSRDSGNTVQAKLFPGGALYLVGANSPRGFRRRTVRVLILEEIDGYPQSAGTEGDQVKLAIRRTATFSYRRKIYLNSTPTLKGASRIENYYQQSDQRRYYVPCPHCGQSQTLEWKALRWDADRPETAAYACISCGVLIPEEEKFRMLAAGAWKPAEPSKLVRGYHINALYSPWVTWAELAAEWLEAQGDPGKLQVFINTALGETWEDRGGALDPATIEARPRFNPEKVPAGVGVLTCGVDVQDDRLEALLWGWGRGEESWVWPRKVFLGNPDQDEVWGLFDQWRTGGFVHESGHRIPIDTCCIDSGDHTDAVYRYVKPRYVQRVYATKGSSRPLPFLVNPKPSMNNKGRVRLFLVGTEKAKDMLHNRLRLTVEGPRYVHFAEPVDPDFFPQLFGEVRKPVTEGSRQVMRWVLPRGHRAEILDCAVLNLVAFQLGRVPAERLGMTVDRLLATPPPDATPPPPEPLVPSMPNVGQTLAWQRARSLLRRRGR